MVILAAGKGTRLKIDIAKPLCLALGSPIVDYVIDGLQRFCNKTKLKSTYGFVVGYKKNEVKNFIEQRLPSEELEFADQQKQLGTGHALKVYFETFPEAFEREYTIVACADTPLIEESVYSHLFNELKKENLDAVCASFSTSKPKGYGRIKKSDIGFQIIEEKEASSLEKQICEVNSGLYIFKTSYIKNFINKLSNENKAGEFYLTDLFKPNQRVQALRFDDELQFLGINNLVQLELAEEILRKKINEQHMLNGVIISNSQSVFIEKSVLIKNGVKIRPNVSLRGQTVIEANSILEEGVIINDSIVGEESTIKAHSYLEGCQISKNVVIGPMARLREGSIIGDNCKLGNFVETKKVKLAAGVKISHLSYAGDAEVGSNTNIGCGFITCNYDGASKHKTKIGSDSFIGSDCQLIAPISIGNNSYIGSGSTINQDVPDGAFAIARQRQTNKEAMAKKFIKKK
jgi:bifunctional UDP-N-acetylglucosamine pyrophosphorylase/glucosamine-1-phosphate N-acetyltransferase